MSNRSANAIQFEMVQKDHAKAVLIKELIHMGLPQFPKTGSDHYLWLRRELDREFDKLVHHCIVANDKGHRAWKAIICDSVFVVNIVIQALLFAIVASFPFLALTIVTIFWYNYETKRTKKIIEEYASYVEKDLQGQCMVAEGLISRISQERATHSK